MQGTPELAGGSKIDPWREKAVRYNREIHALRARVKEVKLGREEFKRRLRISNRERACLKEQNARLLRRVAALDQSTAIRHHSYSAEQIRLFVLLRQYGGMSLRACRHAILILTTVLHFEFELPSITTLRYWEMKLGLDQLRRVASNRHAHALLLDESISLGGQRALVLLGVDLVRYDFRTPLRMEDTEVLYIGLRSSWTAVQIAEAIEQVRQRGYKLVYGCSDRGANLRKVLFDSNLVHVSDCTHALAKMLEKRYRHDPVYLEFCAHTSRIKRRLVLSEYAQYAPPHRRDKARFLNLDALSDWAVVMLAQLKSGALGPQHEKPFAELNWLLNYESFIVELSAKITLHHQVLKVLKHHGLNPQTRYEVQQLVQNAPVEEGFREQIIAYVRSTERLLPRQGSILCCSDVLESMFGKLKYQSPSNRLVGLTDAVLNLANYGKHFSVEQIKSSLESIRIFDLKEWRRKNVPDTALQKRRRLKNTG